MFYSQYIHKQRIYSSLTGQQPKKTYLCMTILLNRRTGRNRLLDIVLLMSNVFYSCMEQNFMAPTDPYEITRCFDSLKPKKCCGHDFIIFILFETYKTINKSFSTGTVPNVLKLATVIPVYKSKDKQLLNNYRPISLLPAVSKIIEKIST